MHVNMCTYYMYYITYVHVNIITRVNLVDLKDLYLNFDHSFPSDSTAKRMLTFII